MRRLWQILLHSASGGLCKKEGDPDECKKEIPEICFETSETEVLKNILSKFP